MKNNEIEFMTIEEIKSKVKEIKQFIEEYGIEFIDTVLGFPIHDTTDEKIRYFINLYRPDFEQYSTIKHLILSELENDLRIASDNELLETINYSTGKKYNHYELSIDVINNLGWYWYDEFNLWINLDYEYEYPAF